MTKKAKDSTSIPRKEWDKIIDEDIDVIDEAVDAQAQAEASDEDDNDAGSTIGGTLEHPSYKALEDKLTEAELKAHENWDKALRAVADMENVKRRMKIDLENAHKYGLENFAQELIAVVDSLEQALANCSEKAEKDPLHEGVELTLKLLLDVLAKFAIQQINPVGQAFDPHLHEAVSMQEDADVDAGMVLTVFQKGYQLNERVIRPARVVVAK